MTDITDINDETISKAITDAFDFWLSQHPISFPEILGIAIQESFHIWFSNNDEEDDIFPFVMERAIRDATTKWLRDHDATETIAKAITDSKVKK